MTRTVLFLSDYGSGDEFVGICHAVLARLAPDVRVIDLTHGIPSHDVLRGALTLADATPYAPEDAVYLAVVDPGVGTARRAVAVAAGPAHLVGPDNGLLSIAAEALGGVADAVEIPVPQEVAATFHGRDVFAPAAARLASGARLNDLGRPVDPATLVRIESPRPEIREGLVRCVVAGVDRFGNLQLGARPEDLARAELERADRLELRAGMRSVQLTRATTFADVEEGELGLLTDSSGRLAVVRNRGSAADALGLASGDDVSLTAPRFG